MILSTMLLILLQSVHSSAAGSGNYLRTGKYGYDNYYRSQQGRKETGLTTYPRCGSETTILDVSVVDSNGKSVGRSKVWLVSSIGMSEAWTSKNGNVRLEVTGCEVGLILWSKDKMAQHKQINLGNYKDKVQKVMIQLEIACNFLIKFQELYIFEKEFEQKPDIISYTVTSGGQTTSGRVAGGELSSQVCIHVQNGDSLYMVISAQNRIYPNILYLTDIREGTDAHVYLPYLTLYPFIDYKDFKLMSLVNVWKYSVDSGVSDGGLGGGFVIASPGLAKIGKCYLIIASFRLIFEGNLKGNAVLYDDKRNLKIVEVPVKKKNLGEFWVLGFIEKSLDTFKQINKFIQQSVIANMSPSSYCDLEMWKLIN